MADDSVNDLNGGGLAAVYARFRGGRGFLYALTFFCAFWMGWNLTPGLPHFDSAGFERLTLILSIEASLSVALLIMDSERQAQAEQRQAKYMLHLMEAVRDNTIAVRDIVTELHAKEEGR